MSDLRLELESQAFKEGARLFGVASVDRFDGALKGHHPCDLLKGAKSVIVIGLPVPKNSVNYHKLLTDSEIIKGAFREEYLQKYYYQKTGYEILNTRLEQIGYSLNLILEEKGWDTIYFTPNYGGLGDIQSRVPGHAGIFSMRHAAVRAGLGEFGLNNLVLTSRYGPRVRFNALITDAELEPTPLLQEKLCLGLSCGICIKKCGGQAIRMKNDTEFAGEGRSWEEIKDQVWLDPVSRTDIIDCKTKRGPSFCTGRCIAVCPVGMKQK